MNLYDTLKEECISRGGIPVDEVPEPDDNPRFFVKTKNPDIPRIARSFADMAGIVKGARFCVTSFDCEYREAENDYSYGIQMLIQNH